MTHVPCPEPMARLKKGPSFMLASLLLMFIGLSLFALVADMEDVNDAEATDASTAGGGTDGADVLIGTAGNDVLAGLKGADQLSGLGGDDTLLGGFGSDVLDGGSGADELQGALGHDTLWGGAGNDRLNGGAEDDVLQGNAGDDVLRGSGGDDALWGGAGKDTLLGNAGADTIYGGSGADTVFGGSGADVIVGHGDFGKSAVLGSEDREGDVLNGERGADTITATAYDTVTGGSGADLIHAFMQDQAVGTGIIVTDFDPTEDRLLFAQSETRPVGLSPQDDRLVIEQAENGTDTHVLFGSALIAVLQNTQAAELAADLSWVVNVTGLPVAQNPVAIEGTSGDDRLFGSVLSDTIFGRAGNDQIQGNFGNDTLFGDAGDDALLGEEGADVLQGGFGQDTLWGQGGNDSLDGSFGDDVLYGGGADDTLHGARGADVLRGGAGDDRLSGGTDADVFVTGTGADVAFGGDGNDLIMGYDPTANGAAVLDNLADTLNGGTGADTITGNNGDVMTGGAGADVFRVVGHDGPEDDALRITDFDPSTDSMILLDAMGGELVLNNDLLASVEVRESRADSGAELLYDGQVLVALDEIDADSLIQWEGWLGNNNVIINSTKQMHA